MLRTACILVATLAACGGAPKTSDKAPPASAPAAFRDMNHDQKLAYMKDVVMPTMQKTFAAFDAKKFGDTTCKLCHGKGADDGDFDMPNAELPKLPDEEHFPAYMNEGDHMKWVKFMSETVTPQMADLLHEKKFDMATKTGFSCAACHTIEGVPVPPHDHDHHH